MTMGSLSQLEVREYLSEFASPLTMRFEGRQNVSPLIVTRVPSMINRLDILSPNQINFRFGSFLLKVFCEIMSSVSTSSLVMVLFSEPYG